MVGCNQFFQRLVLLIHYRPFLNTDPPLIVDIWRRRKPLRTVVESVSRAMLDKFIFAKPYFEREGLILAFQGDEPVGFAHAGFAPNADLSDIDLRMGVLSQLQVTGVDDRAEITRGLLEHIFQYLKSSGANSCYAGSQFPFAPFYMGLYGGSRIPGFLVEDEWAIAALLEFGFVESDRIAILSRNLTGFRMSVDRQIINVRRQYQISPVVDPRERTWWECCSLGMAERDSFVMSDRLSRETVGRVVYWDMLPLANEWGVQTRGIYDLHIEPEYQELGLAPFLLGESLKQLKEQGIGLVEAQTKASNTEAISVFENLGFEETGHGVQLWKNI